jgi:hypothetical protein
MLLVYRERCGLFLRSSTAKYVSQTTRMLQDPSAHFEFRNQGKSDKILETVLRMDGLLRSIHENLV